MGALTITASYDTSVTSLNTSGANLALYNNYVGAVNLAIAYFQNNFTAIGNIATNINIIFGWGSVTVPGAGVTLANGTTPQTGGVSPVAASVSNFAGVKNLATLAAAAPNATVAQKTSWNLISSLATDPTGGGQFTINPAQVKLLDPNFATDGVGTSLGVTAGQIDGGSVINSTFNWNWTQSNFSTGQGDAVSVQEHEISEVLGRSMGGGAISGGVAGYTLMDFYDYSAAGNPAVGSAAAAAVTIGSAAGTRKLLVTAAASPPQTYFSADGTTVGLAFTVPASSADIADWNSTLVPNDSFGSSPDGVASPVSANDVLVLNTLGLVSAACFTSGTQIATADGPVAVENLREGAEAVLAAGGHATIKWIGHRIVDCARHPCPADVWPVRVSQGAFAENAPSQDLILSPDHSVFIDGVLIPIRYLLNGATIRQEARETVTYWHVELNRHDVILAEGLPCESFLDTGNRGAFANGGVAVMLHPDFALQIWEAEACAKLVRAGAELEAARSYLLDRASVLGHRMTNEPDLHVVANGQIVRPEIDGGRYHFALPRGTTTALLMSRRGVPAEMFDANPDHRPLGVAVAALHLDGVAHAIAGIAGQGWHAAEAGWRWTDGAATINVEGARLLTLDVLTGARVWNPIAAEAELRFAKTA